MIRETGLALAVTVALYSGSGTSSVKELYAQGKDENKIWAWEEAKKTNLYSVLNLRNVKQGFFSNNGQAVPEAVVCAYNGVSSSDGIYATQQRCFLNLQFLGKLAAKLPDRKFFTQSDLTEASTEVAFSKPGLYLVRNGKIIDYFPGQNELLVGRENVFLDGDTTRQVLAWGEQSDRLRFLGNHQVRYLDTRKPVVSFETDNTALKIAQKLVNEEKYEAARKLLKRDFENVRDLAIGSMLEGIIHVHENFLIWRNQGKRIDVEKVLAEAQTKFDVAIAADKKYEQKTLEALFDAGVIVYNRRFVQASDSGTVEGGFLAHIIAADKGDKFAFKKIFELTIEYRKKQGKDMETMEKIDLDQIDWNKIKEGLIPDLLVVGWRGYDPDSSATTLEVFKKPTEGRRVGMYSEVVIKRDGKFFWIFEG